LRLGGSNGVRQDWPLPWTHPEREESSLLIRTDNVSTLAEVEGEIEGCVEGEGECIGVDHSVVVNVNGAEGIFVAAFGSPCLEPTEDKAVWGNNADARRMYLTDDYSWENTCVYLHVNILNTHTHTHTTHVQRCMHKH
jgi:hypothetical protein